MSSKFDYKNELRTLQMQLVKWQKHIICSGQRCLIILEGRDASGKDGAIKRITAHASPRDTRIVAPGKPTERDIRAWYFQRFVVQFPINGELVIFNRSWYNRAGVEKVMGYCSDEDYEEFMATVNEFESLLQKSGINLFKYYLDISKEEQIRRLDQRRSSPFKQWKISPVDDAAVELWDEYTKARNVMLDNTSTGSVPWFIVKANNKRSARLNLIRDLLRRTNCEALDQDVCCPDNSIVFPFHRNQPGLLQKLYS